MQIRIFDAATLERAHASVRTALGPDALILATEETKQGVRVTAAIEPETDLAGLLADASGAPDPRLAALLSHHGVPPAVRIALAEAGAGLPLEAGLAEAFRRRLKCAPAALRFVLLGLPGHGKTLQAARLARELAQAGEPPRVLVLAERGTPPDGRLAHWLDGTGVGHQVVRDAATLAAAAAAPGALIVDTPGLSPGTARTAARLRTMLQSVPGAAGVLVLSVEATAAALLETAADFLALGCSSVLPTKLDLTSRYGGLATLALSGVALQAASVSGTIEDALSPLHPSGLARLLVHRFVNASRPTGSSNSNAFEAVPS